MAIGETPGDKIEEEVETEEAKIAALGMIVGNEEEEETDNIEETGDKEEKIDPKGEKRGPKGEKEILKRGDIKVKGVKEEKRTNIDKKAIREYKEKRSEIGLEGKRGKDIPMTEIKEESTKVLIRLFRVIKHLKK